MSAFVQEKEHIDLLVWAANELVEGRGVNMHLEDGTQISPAHGKGRKRIGQILWDTNRDSVAYRYSEDFDVVEYTYTPPAKGFSPGEVIKAVRGYEYQSCEHPEWGKSAAKRFCDALISNLLWEIPEVAEANTWSVNAETVPQSRSKQGGATMRVAPKRNKQEREPAVTSNEDRLYTMVTGAPRGGNNNVRLINLAHLLAARDAADPNNDGEAKKWYANTEGMKVTKQEAAATAKKLHANIEVGTYATLGATALSACPGKQGYGGLQFLAQLGGENRVEPPVIVMLSQTEEGLYNLTVTRTDTLTVHHQQRGLAANEINKALLALAGNE